MRPIQHKGKLITWKDDRGFGFIKPEGGGKEVFLHISELKGLSRRPKVGDTIIYEKVFEAGGKVRASKARIQGVLIRSSPSHKIRKRKKGLFENIIRVSVSAILVILAIEKFTSGHSPLLITSFTKPECDIKGNISINTGRKIYHLPGMEDYESTRISLEHGEKWFCSESEAVSNGWEKAPR